MKELHGSGGGGGGGGGNQVTVVQAPVYQPTYTADDPGLKSVAFAQMQFLLCEGEIEGPAAGNTIEGLESSIYLDDTPIRSGSSITPSPEDLVFSWGRGPSAQTGVPGFTQVSAVTGVDKQVRYGLPVSQTITVSDPEGTYYGRVLLTFDGLVFANNKGDQLGTSVNLTITYYDNLNVNRTVYSGDISGKFAGQFQREFEFKFQGPAPWRLTVTRNTQDDQPRNTDGNVYRTSFAFSTVITSLDQRLKYPHSSVLSIGIRADQYSSLPNVSVELLGRRIQVPTNYDPATRTYATSGPGTTGGVWDGTFKWAYSNNPAWVLRDLMTQSRFGLGDYIDSALTDKWSLYDIAVYCDQPVPAAGGGTEPRFTCNLILQTSEEAWSVLQQLGTIFRGMLYYASGMVVAIQDRDKTPIYTFSEANTLEDVSADGKVSAGNFSYAGPAKRARHTVCLASWDDPSDNYQPRVEYVADEDGLERYGYRSIDLRLIGVTSRGQALRAANWTLLSESLLDDTVSFRTNEIGSAIRPGDVVKIADPTKSAARMGGRIVAVNGTSITLDQVPSNVTAGSNATFSFMAATSAGDPVLHSCSITGVSGNTITVASLPAAPVTTFPWLIELPSKTAQKFRILTVEEQESGVYAFTALRYRSDIYDAVDFNTPLNDNESYLFTSVNPEPPTVTTADVVWDNNQAKILVEWLPSTGNAVLNGYDLTVSEYRLQYMAGRIQEDNSYLWDGVWKESARQTDNRELIPVNDFSYLDVFKVRVAAVNRLGTMSTWTEVEARDLTVTTPLPDISARTNNVPNAVLSHLNQSNGTQLFTWRFNVPLPAYVNGVSLQAKPSRPLVDPENAGIRTPDANGWYTIGTFALSDYYGLAFHSAQNWSLRIHLTTAVPGLEGTSYALDAVNVAEIVPPDPLNLRVVAEGSSQSRVGNRRFSWDMPTPPPMASSWPTGSVTDVVSYEVRFKQGVTPDWDLALPLFNEGVSAAQQWFETQLFDYGIWTIMVRSQDRTGWQSANFAAVTVGLGDPVPTNVVERYDLRDASWPGLLVNATEGANPTENFYLEPLAAPLYSQPYDDEFYELIGGTSLVQSNINEPMDYYVPLSVAYDGAQLVIYTEKSATHRWYVRRIAGDEALMYPSATTEPFYGSDLSLLMYRPEGIDGADGWHPYAPNEELRAGSYELWLRAISTDGVSPAVIWDVDVVYDYPDVIHTVEDLAVSGSGTVYAFPPDMFRKLKALSLTVQDDPAAAGTAVNAIIVRKDESEIEVRTVDASGSPAAALVDVVAVGY